jgi:hypothetical protein
MGRTAKHNPDALYREYCQGRYKSVAEFCKARKLPYDLVRHMFKKIMEESEQQKPAKTGQKNRSKPAKNNDRIEESARKPAQTWERLKKQFTDWPQEKLDSYLVQIEQRLAELNVVDFDELTTEEQEELGQLRRERRAILSDPDPDKICNGHRHGGQPCKNPVERGKEKCWQHGGAPGTGAPAGNKNGMRHGFFSRIMPDDPELKAIIEEIDAKSPIDIVWDQIVIQYAQIARAQKLMYVQDKDDIVRHLKREKESDHAWEKEWEFQYPWDRHAAFLTAQSKAMGTLERLIARHDAMANDEQKLKTAKLKAEIELLKKNPGASEKTAEMEAAIDEAWRKRSEQHAQL